MQLHRCSGCGLTIAGVPSQLRALSFVSEKRGWSVEHSHHVCNVLRSDSPIWCLYMQMLGMQGCAISIAAELIAPRNMLVASGRAFFALLQGAWLVQIAHIMWGGAVLE